MNNFSKLWLIACATLLSSCTLLPPDQTGNKSTSDVVIISITANSESQKAYVNAYAYTASGDFIPDATITVDGTSIVKQSYNGYYAQLSAAWADGSSHTYSVRTPSGGVVTDTVTKPVGTLSGVTYSPAKPTIASSYTVSPPSGLWPDGSLVKCTFENAGTTYGDDKVGTGSTPLVFNGQHLTGASSVNFTAYLETAASITGFGTGSVVTVTGTPTSW